jgi:spore germination protein YaaH
VRGLRVDATGRLHLPEGNLSQDKSLLLCTLDGPQGVIPQVAKAILRSDATQQAILDGLAARLSAIGTGSHGIIFDWQEVLPDCQTSYLAFVKEAGRRLRPMGLQIGLHLPAHSPWQKKIAQVSVIASSLDHLYYEPARRLTNEKCLYPTPPSPLIGVGETRDALTHATDWFPSQKIWLVNRSAGLITKQGEVLETISPHAALQLAYHQEAPLCRDSCSELAWFRTREGGYTVWFEDLWSMVRKIELLHHMNLQGLAMWESGGYFPDAWNYVRDYFETTAEKDTHN